MTKIKDRQYSDQNKRTGNTVTKIKDRQYSDQNKRDKRTNIDQQNNTQKIKEWATWTLLKIRGEIRCSGRVSSSCSTSDIRRVTRYKPSDKSWMRKGPKSVYDKWNISVIIITKPIELSFIFLHLLWRHQQNIQIIHTENTINIPTPCFNK